MKSIGIFSVSGRKMMTNSSLTSFSHQHTIDVSNYPKGVCLIKAELKNGDVNTKKIIIQ